MITNHNSFSMGGTEYTNGFTMGAIYVEKYALINLNGYVFAKALKSTDLDKFFSLVKEHHISD